MKVTLTTENDLVSYLNYLHQQGSLASAIPSITLEGREAMQYLQFLFDTDPDMDEPITEEIISEPSDTDTDKINSRWTQAEKDVLVSSIKNNTHPSDIAIALKRTESGIRHQARTHFKLVYQSGKWRDMNYTH